MHETDVATDFSAADLLGHADRLRGSNVNRSAPTLTPTPRAYSKPLRLPARADRVELAAGRYQLLMFYSPL